MKFSALSRNARFLLGAQLIFLGYAPVLFEIWHINSEISDKNDNASAIQEIKIQREPMSFQECLKHFSNVLGNEFVRYQKIYDILTSNYTLESDNSQNLSSAIPDLEISQHHLANNICLSNMNGVLNFINSVKKMEVVNKSQSYIHTITSGEFAGAHIARGIIESNFYTDATHLTIPAKVVDKVISTLSSKINFRRSLKIGDSFEIMYNTHNELLYAKIMTKRKTATVFGPLIDGKRIYFFENGNEVKPVSNIGGKGIAFASPLPGKLRISSPFGMRFHPISKEYKLHTGVDLMAAHGTQVYSIADGTVTRASYYYGYGNCVDVRHSNGYSSRYAHLSKFAVKVGDHVARGQKIALSGSTGRVNGPHLHMEIAKNNIRINPMRAKIMYPEVKKASNIRIAPKNEFLNFQNNIKKTILDIYSHEL